MSFPPPPPKLSWIASSARARVPAEMPCLEAICDPLSVPPPPPPPGELDCIPYHHVITCLSAAELLAVSMASTVMPVCTAAPAGVISPADASACRPGPGECNCRRGILTAQCCTGQSLSMTENLAMVDIGVQCSLEQVLEIGFYHR